MDEKPYLLSQADERPNFLKAEGGEGVGEGVRRGGDGASELVGAIQVRSALSRIQLPLADARPDFLQKSAEQYELSLVGEEGADERIELWLSGEKGADELNELSLAGGEGTCKGARRRTDSAGGLIVAMELLLAGGEGAHELIELWLAGEEGAEEEIGLSMAGGEGMGEGARRGTDGREEADELIELWLAGEEGADEGIGLLLVGGGTSEAAR